VEPLPSQLYVFAWLSPFIGSALNLALNPVKGRAKAYSSVAFISASAILSSLLALDVWLNGRVVSFEYVWVKCLNVSFGFYGDALSSLMAVVVSWLSLLIAIYSIKYMEGDSGQTRYWTFFTFFVGSMLLLVLADNLVAMFVGWEGTGLASYALIGHWYTDEEDKWVGDPGRKALGIPMYFTPSHGGLRALVFTRIGDVGFLVGIAVIHMLLGTTSLVALESEAGAWMLSLFRSGILLPFLIVFSLGAMAKSAQFPFHEWLVTAMTGPTSVSALIHAATMVKAGVYFMLRMAPIIFLGAEVLRATNPAVFSLVAEYFEIVALIGGLTAFILGTMAIVARELKLILAYSTASQLGYMFLAVGAGALTGEVGLSVFVGFSHLMSHAIFKAALFLVAGAVIHSVHSRFIDDMGGLGKPMKISFASMLLAALSLTGLPPFMGFWTKDAIVDVAFEAHAYLPFVLGVVTVLITAFYSLRMVFRVFLFKPSHHEHEVHEAHPLMWVPYFTLAVACLALGLAWPFYGADLSRGLTTLTLGLKEWVMPTTNYTLVGTSVALVAFGIGIAYYLYQAKKVLPFDSVKTSPTLMKLHTFLYDRWFINSIYYLVIVKGGHLIALAISKYFDKLVVDNLYHRAIPFVFGKAADLLFRYPERAIDLFYHRVMVAFFSILSNGFRRVQTGILNHYMLLMLIGFATIYVVLMLLG